MAESSELVALVAGGSGDIGRAIALRLSADGIRVYIGYRKNKGAADSAVDEIDKRNGWAKAIRLDVTSLQDMENTCSNIYEAQKRLDILVNCAAVNIESPALGMDDEDWQSVIDANLSGAFRLCRAAAKYMLLGRWGRIINVSSISAAFGGRGQINYSSAKAGLESMTRVLALELGRKGILANCVAPGVIASSMSERIRAEHGKRLIENIALRRFGKTTRSRR